MNNLKLTLSEEIEQLISVDKGAYLVELSPLAEESEETISKYRRKKYKGLTSEEREEYIQSLLFEHDYLMEKVKYLEEERFKECLRNG